MVRWLSGRRSPVVLMLVLMLALGLMSLVGCQSRARSERLVEQAIFEAKEGHLADAEAIAVKAMRADPTFGEAYLLAGDLARDQGDFGGAIEHYNATPSEDAKAKVQAHVRAGTVYMELLAKLDDAEAEYRAALAIDDADRDANDGLSYLLSICGRRWESSEYFLAMIRRLQNRMEHLVGIGLLENTLNDEEWLKESIKQDEADPLPRLGLARIALDDNRLDEAEQRAREAIELAPDMIEAHTTLGLALAKQGKAEELSRWHAALPKGAQEHPGIWEASGEWRLLLEDREGALRCYAEAVKINPNSRQAAFQLTRLLSAAGETELAEVLQDRGTRLISFQETLVKIRGDQNNVALMRLAAEQARELGRYWESRGWLKAAQDRQPENPAYAQLIDELNETLKSGPPQTLESEQPLAKVALDRWSLPNWEIASATETESNSKSSTATIRYRDVAEEFGIDFRYYNGFEPRRPGPYLFHSDGGGVAVLDYDLDQWPDLFFTQGCEFPELNPATQFIDRFYRNQRGESAVDVTELSRINETGFGQGVTVGDYNNDGFPDLLVANIGRNRLFENMGDGTFVDVTREAGLVEDKWTASCAIADVNSDGFPDIYLVNYVRGDDVHQRICPDSNGQARICPPIEFEGEADTLLLGTGDGRFVDASEASGIRQQTGKGLGIVIADFDKSGQLSFFIANDVTQNFYWKRRGDSPDGLQFEELAVLSGIATDAQGMTSACMGVAVDDLNEDGLLDLFVTNFHEEPNCLYVQRSPGLFADEAARAALAQPSFPLLGFGTQFTDADLDGRPDLIVANGHLVDETSLGIPYRMQPQLYRQYAKGKFADLPSRSLGKYFEQPALGRGLATLDFDLNGREDFAVSDLKAPASLVLNETENAGRWLALQFVATTTARDAIGVTVEVTTSERTRVRQLTAGNGYQAANQSELIFGLGDAEKIDRLTVKWPSGLEQSWIDVPTDRRLTLIEGDDEPTATRP